MNIQYNEEKNVDRNLLETFRRAAELCVEKEGLEPANMEVSLTFVDGGEIRQLNREYRGVDQVTDVLSFPMIEDWEALAAGEEPEGGILLGDVVINMDRVREQAEEYGHSLEREAVYLFVHSVCHLLGFDHMEEEEKRQMRQREEEVMELLELGRSS